jgi:hypothetical protein
MSSGYGGIMALASPGWCYRHLGSAIIAGLLDYIYHGI